MDQLKASIEAIVFSAGDSVPLARLSLVLDRDLDEIRGAAQSLSEEYEADGRGFRLLFLDDKVQMCSAPEYAPVIEKTLEKRKAPALSPSSLETLAIVAYFQPVTKAYVDKTRGVDCSYSLSLLVDRGIIEPCGRLDVPGRPVLYRTSEAFLRIMQIESLEQLPPLPEIEVGEETLQLQQSIQNLQDSSQV